MESFRRKDLDNGEERVRVFCSCLVASAVLEKSLAYDDTLALCSMQCVQNCCQKFMKGSARVGQRFGELSAEAESQMQQLMQQQGR